MINALQGLRLPPRTISRRQTAAGDTISHASSSGGDMGGGGGGVREKKTEHVFSLLVLIGKSIGGTEEWGNGEKLRELYDKGKENVVGGKWMFWEIRVIRENLKRDIETEFEGNGIVLSFFSRPPTPKKRKKKTDKNLFNLDSYPYSQFSPLLQTTGDIW